jgi:AcrR family transcriptional regulator
MNATPDLRTGERLPSGRHGLTRETVMASQRGRLLEAMARAVAAKGYAAVTVSDVVNQAGVSRRTFYEQFPDLEACFLAAYDTGVELVLGDIRAAVDRIPAEDWRGRSRAAVGAFLAMLSREPEFAWALVVEVMAAGRAALARHAEMMGLFAGIWSRVYDQAVGEDPRLRPLPPEVFAVIAGGTEEMTREGLRERGAAALPELTDDIVRAVFAIFGVDEVRRAPGRRTKLKA